MTSITTRAGKGSPLTHNEVDANFTNLNNDKLDTAGIALGSAASPTLKFTGDPNTGIYSPGADTLAFVEGGVEAMRIDSSGRLLRGTSTAAETVSISSAPSTPSFQNASTSQAGSSAGLFNWSTANSAAYLNFSKSKSGTIGTRGQVSSGDDLGSVLFAGDDGTNFVSSAGILAEVDGTPGTDNMPGRLLFRTKAAGATGTPAERLRIDSSGNVGIGTSAPDVNLHVNSVGNTVIKVSSTFANSTTTGFRVDTTGNASIGRIDFQKSGATRGKISYVHNATAAAELLGFNVAGGADKLVIDGAGNVGIETTSPTTLLDVNADTVRVRTARTPASATATGATGEICWDANYIYVCTATNTWRRTAISSW